MFSNGTESVRIGHSFLKQLEHYKSLPDSMSESDKALSTLEAIGVNPKTVQSHHSYVRAFSNKTKVFKDVVYIGMTSKNSKYRGLFCDVSVLVGEDLPEEELITIDLLGEEDSCEGDSE